MKHRLVSKAGLRCLAQGEGPPLVLLHPIGMRAEFWDSVGRLLVSRFRVLAFDLPGHGESQSVPMSSSIDALAENVLASLSELEKRTALLVGCSMGGMVATAMALLTPDRVKGLVVADAGLSLDEAGRTMMLRRADAASADFPATIAPTLVRWFSPRFSSENQSTVELVRKWLAANDPEVIAAGWRVIATVDHERRLKELKIPVLGVTGELDVAAPPKIAQRMAAAALAILRKSKMRDILLRWNSLQHLFQLLKRWMRGNRVTSSRFRKLTKRLA